MLMLKTLKKTPPKPPPPQKKNNKQTNNAKQQQQKNTKLKKQQKQWLRRIDLRSTVPALTPPGLCVPILYYFNMWN